MSYKTPKHPWVNTFSPQLHHSIKDLSNNKQERKWFDLGMSTSQLGTDYVTCTSFLPCEASNKSNFTLPLCRVMTFAHLPTYQPPWNDAAAVKRASRLSKQTLLQCSQSPCWVIVLGPLLNLIRFTCHHQQRNNPFAINNAANIYSIKINHLLIFI